MSDTQNSAAALTGSPSEGTDNAPALTSDGARQYLAEKVLVDVAAANDAAEQPSRRTA